MKKETKKLGVRAEGKKELPEHLRKAVEGYKKRLKVERKKGYIVEEFWVY